MKKLLCYLCAALLPFAFVTAQTSFIIDYASMEEIEATADGDDFFYNVVKCNSAFNGTDTNMVNWVETRYDSLVNYDYTSGTVINTFPLATSTIYIDSFQVFFGHINTSGTNNAITVTIYRGGAPAGQTSHTGTQVWTQTYNTTTSLSSGVNTNGIPFPAELRFGPHVTLPQGQYFSIRLTFMGVKGQDDFYAWSGFRDNCSDGCAAVVAQIPNSYCYFYNAGTGTLITRNTTYFYDCNGNSSYDANLCEDLYFQDFAFVPLITVTAPFSISPVASNPNICSAQYVTLSPNISGGTGPFTYNWSSGSSSSSPLVYVTSTTTYTVTVTDQGSGQTRTGSVTVSLRSITVNAGNDRTVSCPTSVTLLATPSGTTSGASYLWSSGHSGSSSITVSPSFTTNYVVTVTNSYGCSASDAVTVACSNGCNPPTPVGQLRFTPHYDAINCINQSQSHNQTIYFEMPATFGGYAVISVEIDNILNIPCNINYTTDQTVYAGGDVACITFSGTTNDLPGSYKLLFYVTVNLQGLGPYSDELSALLSLIGQPDVPYYLKIKTTASSCQPTSSLVSRTACNSGQPGDYYISIGGTHSVCSGNFYDSGGPNFDYDPNELSTITFSSSIPGRQVRVIFSQFETESGWDDLSVFDGTSTFAPLIDIYQGFGSAPPVTSTSGSLTFEFDSDGSGQYSGWSATISCVTVPLSVYTYDDVICLGESTQLEAVAGGGTGNYTYSWSPASTLSNPAIANPIATPLTTTTYTVTVSDGSNTGTATATIQVNSAPVVDAGPDVHITECDDTISITASSNNWDSAVWDNGEYGMTNDLAHAGTNTIFIYDQNGCTASDEVNVYLSGSSQIVSFTSPTIGCVNSSITFINTSTHQSGWAWSWNFDDGGSSPTSSATHNFTNYGNYVVTLNADSGSCHLFYQAVIVINPCSGGLNVSINGNTEACSGATTVLTADVSGGDGFYYYSWSPGGSGSSDDTYSVAPNATTTYSLYVNDDSGNSNVASFTITVKPKPFVDAGSDLAICPDGSAQLYVSTDGNTFLWEPSTGLSCDDCVGPVATPSSTTNYSVMVTGTNGCSGYDDVTVAFSSSATASVIIVSSPDPACGGQTVHLTALLTNGGTNPDIMWKKNGTGISNSPTVSGRFKSGDLITVDIVSNLDCANPKEATQSLEIAACTGINDVAFGNISIYPNPNEGNFILQLDGYDSAEPLTLQLFTVDGRQMHHEQIEAQANITRSMTFPNLSDGLYLLRISNQDGQLLKRVMISR